MANLFVLTLLHGGPGFTLHDNDMWGLECALEHGLVDEYFVDNKEWAEAMLKRIRELRSYEPKKGAP